MNSACFGFHHQYQEVLMGSIKNKLPEFYFRLLEIDLILVFDIWKYNQSIMIFYFKEYCTNYWNIMYVSLCFKEITDCFLKYFIWIWAMHNEEYLFKVQQWFKKYGGRTYIWADILSYDTYFTVIHFPWY